MPERSTASATQSASSSPSSHSTFAPPALPRGGGAIRGVGEKLSPNLVTGTGALTIPVYSTPSRGGFHPELTLSYDSGSGNGPFGIGWKLSALSITRRTDRGLPRYEDSDDSDTFLLSGYDDLVPSLRPEDDVVDPARHARVRRYRPRVEGSFTKIERLTDTTTGDVWWSLTMHDGTVHRFGVTAAARVADPADPRRVFEWKLEDSRDLRGNVAQYVYKPEDDAQVPSLPAEDSRRGPQANVYLKRICYGNRAPNDTTAWCFQIVLDYGEHGAAEPSAETGDPTTWPTPDDTLRAWSYRQDPFSTYRAAFEIRTRRLCRRILVFHRFDGLGTGDWTLVRSTDFTHAPSPVATYLKTATQTGWMPGAKKSLPPVEMGYAQPVLDTTIRELAPGALDGLRGGIDPRLHEWVDLDGEGIAGLLFREASAWWYKRNLGQAGLAPPERLDTRPSLGERGPPRLVDLAGAGVKDLVVLDRASPGYFERLDDGWAPFRPFASTPNVDFDDPNLRQLDLDGDGIVDVLVNEDQAFVVHLSEGRDGWRPGVRLRKPSDERVGPVIALQEPLQTIFLADMTGDGLTDLVRIRNGEIVYWPNLGYGRFGPKVTMGSAPAFDRPDGYDPARLRLGDIDGSGTTDIVYLGVDGAVAYFNQSGNAWSAPQPLRGFRPPTKLDSVQLLDLLGSGTSCLVWTSAAPASDSEPLRYLDLMGGLKPHLLVSLDNHLGRQVTLTYAPSTQFYLRDRLAGHPWVTRLPFPVHVVVRVETRDLVARTRLVTRYEYHHGYFDGFERELRGFGRVDSFDTESVGVTSDDTSSELDLPTVVTKTWFHTGVFPRDGSVARHLASEYYPGDPVALGDTLLPLGLGVDDTREACRALKGKPLREEVYALDGQSDVPYVVREHAYTLVPIELEQGRPHGVWFPHARESLELHYERNAADPRITHALTLAVDAYGNVTDEASVAYERLANPVRTQGQRIVTYAHHVFANVDAGGSYFVGLPVRSETFEAIGLAATSGQLVMLGDVAQAVQDAYANRRWIGIDEGAPATPPVVLRELSRTRTRYWNDPQTLPLPEGQVGTRALQHSSDTKVYSKDQPARLYSPRLDGATLASVLGSDCKLGDVDGDGGLWAPSAVVTYDTTFFQPLTQTDPFGNATTIERLAAWFQMFVTAVTDALKNVHRAVPDLRVGAPAQITDANGTKSVAAYDALGMLSSVTMTGTDGAGHTLTGTTLQFDYVLDAWDASGTPAYVHGRALNDWGASPTYEESYTYTDGSGREAMKKVQAEPGPAPQLDANGHVVRDPQGNPVLANVNPRWVGSGRVVFDNKGNPVKKYEPYFSATSAYEDEPELVEWGVSPILRYDPLGRLVRTDFPDQTLSRVVFDAWTVEHWDQNDTVEESGWYQAITNPPAGQPAPSAQLVRAAQLADEHAKTPNRDILDPLGRTVSSLVDAKPSGLLETQYTLDAAGNVTAITDPRGIQTFQTYDLVKRAARTVSPDSGDRAVIFDAAGAVARALTALGHSIVHSYDELRRPELVRLIDYGAPLTDKGTLVERSIYGEALDPAGTDSEHATVAVAINARGRLYERYDGAGLERHERYDLQGRLGRVSRRMTQDYTKTGTWAPIDDRTLPLSTIDANAAPLLEPASETFTTETDYDALGRPKRIASPDGSEAYPTYNEAGLLETVGVKLRGAATLTPFVTNLDYDARGQRTLCQHANGADTSYDYDPNTFRLRELRTARAAGTVQDCRYTYDPVGNVVQVDDAAEDAWFGSAPGTGSLLYEYDAAYRLTRGAGREQGTNGQVMPPDGVEAPFFPIPDATDTAKVRQYQETFTYDASGNLTGIKHDILNAPGLSGWTRAIPTESASDRLAATAGGASTGYAYDAHGNLLTANGQTLTWDYADRLQKVDLGGGGTAYYAYDAAGNRVRKVVQRTGALVQRRDYVGSWERYRSTTSGTVDLERETLHVMDDERRVALVETKTIDAKASGPLPETRARWQIDNHLGSVAIELDESAAVISYEEYYPYGGTAYLARTGVVETSPKRYRYNGKERDEETGLYYYGARYYAPWLGKWTSADPKGLSAGTNVYAYVHDSPARYVDPIGQDAAEPLSRTVMDFSNDAATFERRGGHVSRGHIHRGSVDVYQLSMGPISVRAEPRPETPYEVQERLYEAQQAARKAVHADYVRDVKRFLAWNKDYARGVKAEYYAGPGLGFEFRVDASGAGSLEINFGVGKAAGVDVVSDKPRKQSGFFVEAKGGVGMGPGKAEGSIRFAETPDEKFKATDPIWKSFYLEDAGVGADAFGQGYKYSFVKGVGVYKNSLSLKRLTDAWKVLTNAQTPGALSAWSDVRARVSELGPGYVQGVENQMDLVRGQAAGNLRKYLTERKWKGTVRAGYVFTWGSNLPTQ